MFYSPEHGRLVVKDELSSLFNMSLPKDLERSDFITKDIADLLGLIHITPGKPPADFDPDFQEAQQDISQITYNSSEGTATTLCVVIDIWEDVLDEGGAVVKTKQQVKEEFDQEQERLEQEQEELSLQESLDYNEAVLQSLLDDTAKYVIDDYTGEDKSDWIAYRAALKVLKDHPNWGPTFEEWPESPDTVD